ncbi:hypothetical protein [Sulfitobacter sp. CW3]|uniref:hypothetical protein n=1 Tax=Sulfitobacter sp. CW3 TaxID=2861965 RepID=UPI001C5F5327|nr:hypothetical protein [Sulfitobacter sp. CW3]MBW4962837.1 hypothetical protein [Sulfitobacter sp. CW3]
MHVAASGILGSLLPFAAVAHKITAKSEGERRQCGTLPSFVFRASLTQHLLAVAAHVLSQRGEVRQSGHSLALFWLESRPL